MQKFITLWIFTFAISYTVMAQSNITKVEYFFNVDPGFGKGVAIAITPAANVPDISCAVPVNILSSGLQTLFIRSANANNVWSITNHLWFFKTSLPPASNISAAEYFIDNDPGFGLAAPISLTVTGSNASDITVPVSIALENLGLHTLFIRSKDSNGKWSLTNRYMFLKTTLPSAPNVVKAEYFIDVDPGFDKATSVSKPINGVNAADVSEQVNLNTVMEGLHQLFLRSKDANNKWSLTNNYLFYKTSNALFNLNDAEYFVDSDPGFGKGRKFPSFTPSPTVSDISYTVDLSGIDSGIHRLFIRSKNANNKWSLTNYLQFRKVTVLPVTLLAFEAVALNDQVMLEWQTGMEQNTGNFDIEYSSNGSAFSKIASVPAKGNATSQNKYTFLHTSPLLNGANYYRLKEIDIDGTFTYSAIRSIKFMSSKTFLVNPNPVHNNLTIYTSEKGLTVHIFESTGRKLMSRQISSNATSIDFSSMVSGIYYVVAERNGKPVYTEKIFKQ